MFQSFSQYTKRQGLHSAHGLFARLTVCHDAWQVWDLRNPTAVLFPLNFD
ncbi:MAG TPA: hypothetical protein VN541_01210 [Tepidisphaeraceae bacterium]|nr:hypothetical protein [Tepidisphaeraceae bacterium]